MHSGDFESSSTSWCNYILEFMGNTDNDLHGLTYISIVLSKDIEINKNYENGNENKLINKYAFAVVCC